MTLLMPSGSLTDFEKNLTSSKLEELLSRPRLACGPTNITIPKFKIACETNLKDQLSKLGFGDLFDESKKHNYARFNIIINPFDYLIMFFFSKCILKLD